jgi:predicted ATP-dependent protease
MLSEEVIKAVIARDFHIYAVRHIDEGIEILTGLKAGDLETEGTIHYKVNSRLAQLADANKEKAGE